MEYRAFECQFFTVGGGFDQDKVLKVKCPGWNVTPNAREGMLHLHPPMPGRECYTFVLIGLVSCYRLTVFPFTEFLMTELTIFGKFYTIIGRD